MNEINLKGYFGIRVEGMWPGDSIGIWVVPDKSEERAPEELIRVFDGPKQEIVLAILKHSWILLSSGDNVVNIISSDGLPIDKSNFCNLACHKNHLPFQY